MTFGNFRQSYELNIISILVCLLLINQDLVSLFDSKFIHPTCFFPSLIGFFSRYFYFNKSQIKYLTFLLSNLSSSVTFLLQLMAIPFFRLHRQNHRVILEVFISAHISSSKSFLVISSKSIKKSAHFLFPSLQT